MSVACSYIVAAANRALYSDNVDAKPCEGDQVEYDGCGYEVIRVNPQAPANAEAAAGEPQAFIVHVRPVERGNASATGSARRTAAGGTR